MGVERIMYINISNVSKRFTRKGQEFTALDHVNLTIEKG